MSACFGTQRVMPDTMPPDPAKHVNYVRGMVLEVDEFKQEFAYHAGRDRSLAREAIGYGTLRGLALSWVKDSAGKLQPSVLVKTGIALSPCGQLICVGSDQCADINPWLADRTKEISDKFGADISSGELALHVTLAYSDCPTDDAPVPGEPCRSEQDLMQPSRITDSFQMELSYEAPLQAEEDALRGFSSWLRKLKIVDDGGTSVALEAFTTAVRGWNKPTTNPGAINIRTSDVPIYSTTALRLWVTELRASVERSGAKQRFTDWLDSVPIPEEGSTISTSTEQEFLAEVRRWTPRTYTWPATLVISNLGTNKQDFINKALNLWKSEIAPKWYADSCGCRAPNNPEYCDDRLLLGTLRFSVIKTSGNVWMVDMPATSTTTPLPVSPSVNESRRPILAQLHALQAQLIPSPEPVAEGTTSLVLSQSITTRHVAIGRVKFLEIGQTQLYPVFGNIRLSGVIKDGDVIRNDGGSLIQDGEVRFTFDGYSKPNSEHDYLVQVLASFTGNKSEPALRFVKFDNTDFIYKVTRSNKPVLVAELKTMEFHVDVSINEKH